MNTQPVLATLALGLLMATAQAQTAAPLNLKLPPGSVPASSSSAAAASDSKGDETPQTNDAPAKTSSPRSNATTSNQPPRPAPGVYYGDTSGRTSADEADARPRCDDATYNQPQVHGSVGMGVVTGNHWGSGTYNSGAVNITQRTGSCDHPTGGIGLSIGVSRFNGR